MNIHFIGIGGIGVSALAQYYLAQGHKVSGSDLVSSEITDALKKLGAKISIGPHKLQCLIWQIKQIDLVIYSPAVGPDNPELREAKKLKIKCQSYPRALGELTKKYFTIAVCGTHGKSTTTAMLGLVLVKAGLDPTVIVGTKLKEFGDSNFRPGKSRYLVIEADEYGASFLNYWPKIIVLTNIEEDHLDYYKNLKNILKTFQKFIKHLPQDGVLIANRDDRNISKLKTPAFAKATAGKQNSKPQFKVQNYSLKQKETKILKKILKIPGEHNISNALAVLVVGRILGISDKAILRALSEYKGSWRRFDITEGGLPGNVFGHFGRKITIVSDYGHHPTEIKVTLKAAREKWPKKEIWCVFEPHQYQRTYYLFDNFVKVLSRALRPVQGKAPVNKLIVSDIYDVAGREDEKIKDLVSSKKIVEKIKKQNVLYIPTPEKIIKYLKENLKGGEVLIVMGAGDIYKLVHDLRS